MSGQRIHRLTVLSRAPSDSNGNARWNCICDCGNSTVTSGFTLRNGEAKSCGCLTTEQLISRITKHHKARTPEYRTWASMIQRCTNPNTKRFPRYGGRGIAVCDSWFDFEQFYKDMGPRPTRNHTIERIDTDENYEPKNCTWATKKEQNNNKSDCRWVEYNGRKMSLTMAIDAAGNKVGRGTVFSRLRYGWPVIDVIETPTGHSRPHRRASS